MAVIVDFCMNVVLKTVITSPENMPLMNVSFTVYVRGSAIAKAFYKRHGYVIAFGRRAELQRPRYGNDFAGVCRGKEKRVWVGQVIKAGD